MHYKLVRRFEEIRQEVQYVVLVPTPIHVSSGYRCVEWNLLVGGSPKSWHLRGMALDLHTPRGLHHSQFVDLVHAVHGQDGGVLIYDWGVHIDMGNPRLIDMRGIT